MMRPTPNRARLVETFTTLVAIDNPSGHEALMAQTIMALLQDEGIASELDAKGNLLARVPGDGPALLLSSHMDSVAPAIGKRAVTRDDTIYSAGDTVLGADDLGGLAAILEAVRTVRASGLPHRALELVFSVEEEIGLKGAKAFDWSSLTAHEGIALDMSGAVGGICVAAPAHDTLAVTITGKAAHAGVAPEAGISAIRVAAEAIAAMPLGRIDAETTANIGTITGGAAKNIVPERVVMIGEARSRDNAKLARQTAAMVAAFEEAAARHGAHADIIVTREYDAMRIAADAEIVQRCQAAITQIGLTPALLESGGGSDVSIANMHGITAVNLCLGYEQIHSTAEHIAIADLERATALVIALVLLP